MTNLAPRVLVEPEKKKSEPTQVRIVRDTPDRESPPTLQFRSLLLKGIAAAALIAFPLLIQHTPYAHFIRAAGVVGLYLILALGLNFTLGYVGLFDLGYIAFYAIGAYVGALCSISGFSFWSATTCAALVALAIRVLVGSTLLRLRGDYLAIVTMGFGEITRLALNNMDFLTNGPKGLPRVGETITPVHFFGFVFQTNTHYYYLIGVVLCLVFLISRRLEDSRIGRAWVAIREDEVAAELTGIPVAKLKLFAFAISAVFAAVAGSIFAHWERFVTPESFIFWESILIVAMVVVGGMGSIGGVTLGAILLGGAPQILQAFLRGSSLISYRYFFFGLVLVLVVMFRPQGLLPSKRKEAS